MQIIVIKYNPLEKIKDAYDFAMHLNESKHGGIVVVPNNIEYDIIEIDGDELPVVLGIDDKTFKIVA